MAGSTNAARYEVVTSGAVICIAEAVLYDACCSSESPVVVEAVAVLFILVGSLSSMEELSALRGSPSTPSPVGSSKARGLHLYDGRYRRGSRRAACPASWSQSELRGS